MYNYKILFHYVKLIKWQYSLSIILVTLEAIALIVTVALQQRLIDGIFIKRNFEDLTITLCLFFFSFISYAILFTITPHVFHLNAAKLRIILVKGISVCLSKIPIYKIEDNRSAKFVHYFTQDVEAIIWTIANNIPRGIQNLMTIIILAFFIGKESILILLFLIIISVFYFVINKYFSSKIKLVSEEVQEKKSNLLVHIEEGISSSREIIAFNKLDWEERKYYSVFKGYLSSLLREGKLLNKQLVSTEALKWMGNLICLAYGGFLVIQGDISLGIFVVIFQFISKLMDAFQTVARIVMEIYRRFPHFERVENLMATEKMNTGKLSINQGVTKLTFNGVDYSYGDRKILKNISLEVPLNKKVAFIGSSGCGKSTIAKLLIRFIEPAEGKIYINQIPLDNISRENWGKVIGVVFQEPYLFPDTVRNNILLGAESVSNNRMVEICKKMKIHEFVIRLPKGYDTVIGDRGITLSGGQRQRLALARALIKDPDILILDEATSALDLETERQVQKNIDELRSGKTTIVIAHRLSTIQNSDIIYIVNQGEIHEFGKHNELLQSSSVYRQLNQNQLETVTS